MKHDADRSIADLARRVIDGLLIGRDEALWLIRLSRKRPFDLLYWANRIRTARFGKTVRLCSIVAGKTGGCSEDCHWCAQSVLCQPKGTPARRARPADIGAAAQNALNCHAAAIGIVNSGRRPSAVDLKAVISASERIRTDLDGQLDVCASLGEVTVEQAHSLAKAGVRNYNHNLETSRRMFAKVVTTHSYDDRLATLAAARKGGLRLCCGCLLGIGETWLDRCELALTLRDKVRPAVVPLNFLHPITGTPLADAKPLKPLTILRIIAIFRFILPDVDLRLAGGREFNLRGMQSWMFYAGATGCMVGNYLTTAGQTPGDDLKMIDDLDMTVVRRLRRRRR